MVDESTIISIKDYLKKLRRIVVNDAEFDFCGYKLIKKIKVDDALCCLIATLPKSYKKALADINSKLQSRIAYNMLYEKVKKKFFLNQDLYIFNTNDILEYLDVLMKTFEKDIEWAEKHDY